MNITLSESGQARSETLAEWVKQCPRKTTFNDLPRELKNKIWSLCLTPDPRVVKVQYDVKTGRFHCATRPPRRISACKSSRLVYFELHNLPFGRFGLPYNILLNLQTDIVSLEWEPFRLKALNHLVFENVRHLELRGKDLQWVKDAAEIVEQLLDFTSLETLTLVSPPPRIPFRSASDSLSLCPLIDNLVCWLTVADKGGYRRACRTTVEQIKGIKNAFETLRLAHRNYRIPALRYILTNPDGSRGHVWIV